MQQNLLPGHMGVLTDVLSRFSALQTAVVSSFIVTGSVTAKRNSSNMSQLYCF